MHWFAGKKAMRGQNMTSLGTKFFEYLKNEKWTIFAKSNFVAKKFREITSTAFFKVWPVSIISSTIITWWPATDPETLIFLRKFLWREMLNLLISLSLCLIFSSKEISLEMVASEVSNSESISDPFAVSLALKMRKKRENQWWIKKNT